LHSFWNFIFNAFQIINYEFQAQVKSKYPSIISLFVTIILNLLKIFVIASQKGVIYLASILLLESVLYSIFYWYFYEKKLGGKLFHWKFDTGIAKSLLIDSWPLIFFSAFALVYARIDQVLIKHMMDARAVGIYGAAVAIAEVWYFIPNIIVPSLFPAIINAQKTSKELYYSRLKKLIILLFSIALVISVFVTLAAPIIIKIIYGEQFINSTDILKIYVWSTFGTFLGNLATSYLIAENKKGLLIFFSFVPMITNVILNILLIPKYGMIGSALATLISYSLGPLSLYYLKT
jgi:O-antigen/teichoic acid export membrane protein